MDKNVTFYGMAHSGKSTCIGFMYSKTREKDKDYNFERLVRRMRSDIPEYDESRDYGYLVDEFKNERKKMKTGKTGTSKQIHFKHIEIGGSEYTAIDTPGSAHKRCQRQKGIFYGDIGVFCIEINQLISDDLFAKKDLYAAFIASLILWTKYHGSTIVALTKMDTCGFDEDAYLMGCEVIHQLCGSNIKVSDIVPIAVEVRERRGHNIERKSERMPWYKGNTLEEVIKKACNNKNTQKHDNPLLFYVDGTHERTSHNGRIWRVKVLQGNLQIGDEVAMAPVRIGSVPETITARIKSIRMDFVEAQEGKLGAESVSAGTFVGLDLKDIRCGARKLNKEDFEVLNTTCGYSSCRRSLCSDRLIFKVGFLMNEKFTERRQMGLLWFGREVPFRIISREKIKTGVLVTAQLLNRHLAMPLNEDSSYMMNRLIIRYDNNGYENENPYIDAELIKLI